LTEVLNFMSVLNLSNTYVTENWYVKMPKGVMCGNAHMNQSL